MPSLTQEQLELRLREISERLRQLHESASDMNSADWDRDHRDGSDDRWQESRRQAEQTLALQQAELSKIDELRDQHRELMTCYIFDLTTRLRKQAGILKTMALQSADTRFLATNLGSIADCLEEWLHVRADGRHWPGWAWRVVYSTQAQAEKLCGIVPVH